MRFSVYLNVDVIYAQYRSKLMYLSKYTYTWTGFKDNKQYNPYLIGAV